MHDGHGFQMTLKSGGNTEKKSYEKPMLVSVGVLAKNTAMKDSLIYDRNGAEAEAAAE